MNSNPKDLGHRKNIEVRESKKDVKSIFKKTKKKQSDILFCYGTIALNILINIRFVLF